MAFKVFVVCASVLLIQSAFGQYIPSTSVVAGNSVLENNVVIGNSGLGLANSGITNSGIYNSGFANSGINNFGFANSGINNFGLANSGINNFGLSNSGIVNTGFSGLNVGSSGPLIVTSISPIGPSGLAVASENTIEGILSVSGSLPYLSAVAFEGSLPTAGSGVATCGCGNGNVGIISEGLAGKNVY